LTIVSSSTAILLVFSFWRREGSGGPHHRIPVLGRAVTKRREAPSSQGVMWRGQGATGISCTLRGFISI